MSKINYVVGDVTRPQGEGVKLIIHCCNNENKWGAGFVLALNKRWKQPKQDYYSSSQTLGTYTVTPVEQDICVINMIGQDGTVSKQNPHPVKYDALYKCLNNLAEIITRKQQYRADRITVHAPRFGAGLAKGSWQVIEGLIKETLIAQGIEVFIYDLPGE